MELENVNPNGDIVVTRNLNHIVLIYLENL
jgi:hypothetical protein